VTILCGNKPDTKGILADHTEARHLSLVKTPSASILLDLRRDASILWGVATTRHSRHTISYLPRVTDADLMHSIPFAISCRRRSVPRRPALSVLPSGVNLQFSLVRCSR
jgi:hypothetical protein